MELKNLFAVALVAGLMAGCAQLGDATSASRPAEKKELTEPEMVQLKDPNPFANYGPAMASTKGLPMAYEWQKANDAAIAQALEPKALAPYLESDVVAGKLLAQVKGAYASDPVVLTQIATISQRVMCPTCPKAPKNRARWTAALLAAAKDAPDAYRTMFFLDQLRWCGHADEADAVRAIGKASKDKAVKAFAEQVAGELAQ